MKNKKNKILITTFILCILIGLSPVPAFAESTDLNITIDSQEIVQGEVFTITLTFTSSSDAIGTLNANLSYDEDILEYQSGGSNRVQLGNGTGVISDNGSSSTKTMSYSFKFLAKKAGEANFSVVDAEIISFDAGTLLGSPQESITLSIGPSQEQGNTPSIEIPDPKDDPIEADIDGKRVYIFRKVPEAQLPEGFEPTPITFKGQEVQGAKNPSTEMMLLYGIDPDFYYSFYRYEATSEILSPYRFISVDQEYTLLPLNIHPKGYQQVDIEIEGKIVPALKPDEDFKGLYLVHAVNKQGDTGYYFYDQSEGTMQRVVVESKMVESSDLEENNKGITWLIIALITICIVLLILIILLSSSFQKSRRGSRNKQLKRRDKHHE